MELTKEKAREKWCPMARHTMDQNGNFHSPNDPNSTGMLYCMASGCMVWVEVEAERKEVIETKWHPTCIAALSASDGWRETDSREFRYDADYVKWERLGDVTLSAEGHCGLVQAHPQHRG